MNVGRSSNCNRVAVKIPQTHILNPEVTGPMLAKIGLVVVEIAYLVKYVDFYRLLQKGAVVTNLWGYWTDLDHICIQCIYNIATEYF